MDETVKKFGRVDILVNNASYQVCLLPYPKSLSHIGSARLPEVQSSCLGSFCAPWSRTQATTSACHHIGRARLA